MRSSGPASGPSQRAKRQQALVGELRLRPRDERGGERLHELVGGRDELAAERDRLRAALVADDEFEHLVDVALAGDAVRVRTHAPKSFQAVERLQPARVVGVVERVAGLQRVELERARATAAILGVSPISRAP